MRTVKQVANLTGVSVRTLQYYDEIGLLKPTTVTEAGYRLYDDDALKSLQQILFFKELNFPLKQIKEIMSDPNFDQIEAFKKQKELIRIKRDRLNGLLTLLEKLEKGESAMSFKEFDMSDYLQTLEQFKNENTDEVIKNWGSVEKFDEFVQSIRENESEIAKAAIKQYGSIEKYTETIKHQLSHFSEYMEKIKTLKAKNAAQLERNKLLTNQLVSDLTKDVKSPEIQAIIDELVQMTNKLTSELDLGEHYWDMMIDGYLNNAKMIDTYDKLYGEGASNFIGRAYQYYFSHKQPLY